MLESGLNTRTQGCIHRAGEDRARERALREGDGLKQFLFGPIDGPPRNTPQIGMPG